MNAEMTNTTAVEAGQPGMSFGRVLGAYRAEIRSEVIRYLRMPSFILPLLLFPSVFYLIFGVVVTFGPPGFMERYLLASYGSFGIMGTGLFGFGVSLALERGGGLLTLKRALPMPPAAYLLGKMVMAMLCATLVVALLQVLGFSLAHVDLSVSQVLGMLAAGALGVLPFCALGMLLGTLLKGQGAPGFVNLVYLPMAFLSGLWVPLQVLPGFVTTIAHFLPSYYLNQVLLRAAGSSTAPILVPVLVLAAWGAACLWLAAWRLRRIG